MRLELARFGAPQGTFECPVGRVSYSSSSVQLAECPICRQVSNWPNCAKVGDINYELSALVVCKLNWFFSVSGFLRVCCWNSTDLPDSSLLLVNIFKKTVPLVSLSNKRLRCYFNWSGKVILSVLSCIFSASDFFHACCWNSTNLLYSKPHW